ncbi:MAG: PfkB family carbohydrate kinase [Cyanobacteriota bacterium]
MDPAAALVPIPLAELPPLPPLALAAVGHVEVVSFVEVEQLPVAGSIGHATHFQELAAGGGAVVAVQLAKLSGRPVPFFTSLGRDAAGEQAAAQLEALGLELHVAWRDAPSRRGISFSDARGERSSTVIGDRRTPPAAVALPWHLREACGGVFVTAADPAALRLARRARVLAATPRVRLETLREAAVPLDALIGSGLDPAEHYEPGDLQPEPRLVIATEGAAGGRLTPGGPGGRFLAPERQRPPLDAYGAGDCFAAGVTAGLAAGWSVAEAVSLGCHCGSACLDGRGPYGGQLEGTAVGGSRAAR